MRNNNITRNIQAHDKIFRVYNLKHSEIYNSFEQNRIDNLISGIIKKRKNLKVLDVGAGTGNLSLKFLNRGCEVTASDVSINSLNLLRELSNNNPKLRLAIIKDEKLPFQNNQFDIVCTYSVLHHIHDYFFTVKEMIRVCKPGGLIYIDHEANKNRYFPNEMLREYQKLTKQTFLEHIKKLYKTRELFLFSFWKGAVIKIFIDPRFQREGDIHVWKDDYIEWDKIKRIIKQEGCKIIEEKDYLMYKPKISLEVYDRYKDNCNDTKYIIFEKSVNL